MINAFMDAILWKKSSLLMILNFALLVERHLPEVIADDAFELCEIYKNEDKFVLDCEMPVMHGCQ